MAYRVYWGDSHLNIRPFQVEECGDAFEEARRRLDFLPVAYYPFVQEDLPLRVETVRNRPSFFRDWEKILEAVEEYNEEGRFVTFPGYEWHGNRRRWGDHNVYYPGTGDAPLLDTWELPDLFVELKRRRGIAVPHHTAYEVGQRGKDWSCHDDDVTPFTEVYSGHGCSERAYGLPLMEGNHNMGPRAAGGTAVEGLDRGYRLGFIASGDNHGLYAGLYGKGLMAVLARGLTREALWEAFMARRVYGVSGERILLDFSCEGEPMGSVLRRKGGEEILFSFSVEAGDEIERVELVKNGRIVDEVPHVDRWPFPSEGKVTRWKVRVETGWGPSQAHGFRRPYGAWECCFEGVPVLGVEECFTAPGNRIIAAEGTRCTWRTRVPLRESGKRGAANTVQAVIVEYRGTPRDRFLVRGNGLCLRLTAADLRRGPRLAYDLHASRRLAEETFGIDFSAVENHDVLYHTADKMRLMRALPEAAWRSPARSPRGRPPPGGITTTCGYARSTGTRRGVPPSGSRRSRLFPKGGKREDGGKESVDRGNHGADRIPSRRGTPPAGIRGERRRAVQRAARGSRSRSRPHGLGPFREAGHASAAATSSAMASHAVRMISSSRAAEDCTRRRAVPSGTTG